MAKHRVLRMQGRSCVAAHPRHCKRIEIHQGSQAALLKTSDHRCVKLTGVISEVGHTLPWIISIG
jgi:hypothetical protein